MTGNVRHRRQDGFTYVGVLIVVAVMGVWLTATAAVWHFKTQREKEQELLDIGHQFRLALNRYAASTVGSGRRFPMRLEDLLLDERFAQKRRHLRRIFTDPMTGTNEWGLTQLADGEIIGVHSLSTRDTIKKAGFDLKDQSFNDVPTYAEWVFAATVRLPPAPAPAGVVVPAGK